MFLKHSPVHQSLKFFIFLAFTVSSQNAISVENMNKNSNQGMYQKLKQNAGKQLEQINNDMVSISADIFIKKPGISDTKETVRVKSFEMSRFEITQEQWQSLMINNPSHFRACAKCPVESVSWNDVQDFIDRLNQVSGKKYRLPTSAEWSYACNAGKDREIFCGSNVATQVGWYANNSSGRTHTVGQKQANAFGIYDMSGNVLEWTADCVDEVQTDLTCNKHAVRGGYWGVNEWYLRTQTHNWGYTGAKGDYLGFRLARDI